MPRKRPGTWEGKPHLRWVKMVKGVRYRVSCAELGLPESEWTEVGSIKAAAEWMDAKLNAQPALDPLNQQLADILDRTTPDDLRRLAVQGAEARRILAILDSASVDGQKPTAMPVAELATLPIPERVITTALAADNPFYTTDDNPDELARIGRTLAKPKVETCFTLKHHAARFLELELAKNNRPRTYGELSESIDAMLNTVYKGSIALSSEMDVRTIDKTTVENYFLFLRHKSGKVPAQQKKQWGFFKRLVRYIWEAELIDLPKNLDSNSLTFKVTPQKIKKYDKQEIVALLKRLPDRLKLYALLALNCGMLSVDIGNLLKEEVDLKRGRITRKRTKTSDDQNVPEVDYKLWPSTLKLLRQLISDHDTLALTSKTGTKLWEHWIGEDGKEHEKNLISLQWKKAKSKLPLKAFRSIGATIIGDHKEYGRYYSHYLGHSPKSIGDKHYVSPSDDLFDEIMAYVGRELGLE